MALDKIALRKVFHPTCIFHVYIKLLTLAMCLLTTHNDAFALVSKVRPVTNASILLVMTSTLLTLEMRLIQIFSESKLSLHKIFSGEGSESKQC